MSDVFLDEYSNDEAVRRYTRRTAGSGIEYLLDHDYAEIYLDAIRNYIPDIAKRTGLRLLEFGCGGGMNIIHLLSLLEREKIPVERAYGADFSKTLIGAANREADAYLTPESRSKLQFAVARNESLIDDLVSRLGVAREKLTGSFHLILGINTIRYCHRIKKEHECTQGLLDLLCDGGVCIVIDMNKGFPFFRSFLRDRLTKRKEEYILLSLDEYAGPFAGAGFEILRKERFCWIPHSSGPRMQRLLRALTPALNFLARRHAMRCLVVARKRPK